MLRKKFLIYFMTFSLAMALFTGCGNAMKENSDVTTETTENAEKQANENAITVQVISVKDGVVTAQVGELSEGFGMSGNGDTPPEMPNGDNPQGEAPEKPAGDNPQGEAPEKPAGDNPQGEAPEMPSGDMPQGMGGMSFIAGEEEVTFQINEDTKITMEYLQGTEAGTIDDIAENAVLEVTLDENNQAVSVVIKNLNKGNGFGGSSEVTNGTSANTITEDSSLKNETYTSSGDDENALRIDGAEVSLENITVNKEGGESSNTEDGDFYGQNAGVLALNGATVKISGAAIRTDAVNGNAVFSYGEGTTVNISDSSITTMQNNSGGIQTTGGGTTNATNLQVETQGNSAAAIRSDRGGGTVNVTGGTYTTSGSGSPAIYCTADIKVSDATLTANASEGVVVEGKNSVELTNCTLKGSMSGTYNGDSDENIHGIMIYQSMSGDAAVGKSEFKATGGSIATTVGDLFYVTNTSCEISLENVELVTANDTLFDIAGNNSSRGWGTAGSNGGEVTLTTTNQTLKGNILVDDISSLSYTMKTGTHLEGAINSSNQSGTIQIVMDTGASWTLTGDTYVSSFDGDLSQITANGHHFYVNGEQKL